MEALVVEGLSGIQKEQVSLDHLDKVMMVVHNLDLVIKTLVEGVELVVLVEMEMA